MTYDVDHPHFDTNDYEYQQDLIGGMIPVSIEEEDYSYTE